MKTDGQLEDDDVVDDEDNNIIVGDDDRHGLSSGNDADDDSDGEQEQHQHARSSKRKQKRSVLSAESSSSGSESDNQQLHRDHPVSRTSLPFKKKKKKKTFVLGADVSSSSNTDLYSTDEARPEKHSAANRSRAEGSTLFEDEQVMDECSECKGPNKMPHIVFEISADGVQIQKKSVKTAAWPLMGQMLYISPCIHLQHKVRFYFPRNSHPVIIGFYHGTTKPKCPNEYLHCLFKEMRLAEKRRLCTSFLQFYIGDGPSRQFIKGFPSSTAYCGCERYVKSQFLFTACI